MTDAIRDGNHVPVALGVSTTNATNTLPLLVDPATGKLQTASSGGGTGTVTSVAASGGTTGLTFTGSPITTSGTLTLGGTLIPANGGTGTTTVFTAGSVVFAGTSGVYSQDNTDFFWDNTNKRLGIGTTGSTNLYFPLTVGNGNFAFTNTTAGFAGSSNSFLEVTNQNTSNGTLATSDFVTSNDTSNNLINYTDMGVTSSTFADLNFTLWGGASCGYLFNEGARLTIATSRAGAPLVFGTGGTLSANERIRITDTSTIITETGAMALAVGQTGATNPALSVDTSIASSVTGITVQSNAVAAGVLIQVTSPGTNENMTIGAKGAGNVVVGMTGNSPIILAPNGQTRISVATTSISFGTMSILNTAATVRFGYTGSGDGSLTLSTEAPNVYFNIGQSRNHATGALTLQRDYRITGTNHTFTGASTLTDHAVFAVDQLASTNATNATITNTSAIYVPTVVLGTGRTNSWGLNISATTGATNNYAARIIGQVVNGGATPGIAAGTGAGGSPTVSITGANNGGIINVTTGTAPTLSAVVVTVTFSNPFPSSSAVVLYPANANTTLLSGTSMVFTTGGSTTFTITSGSVALTTVTAYSWNYQVIGY